MTRSPDERGGAGRHDDGRDDEPEVWAGGGVVVDEAGRVLLVHRSRYDDWSFPKGKLDPGETLEQCALREVAEETGFACSLGAEVAVTRYVDHKGRDKLVRYWLMTVDDGVFEPNDEVDEIRWVAPADAASLLSYDRDAAVLGALEGPPSRGLSPVTIVSPRQHSAEGSSGVHLWFTNWRVAGQHPSVACPSVAWPPHGAGPHRY